MSETTPTTTPDATATGGNDDKTDMTPPPSSSTTSSSESKKKAKEPKAKPLPPVPPPAINHAALVVRAAIAKVFGIPPHDVVGLQPTWVTEKLTGKLTMSLDASRRVPFPKDPAEHEGLLDLVELEIRRLQGSSTHTVRTARGPRDAVVAALAIAGATLGNGDTINAKKSDVVRVAVAGGFLIEDPNAVAVSTCGPIEVVGRRENKDDKKKPDTTVLLAGKKKHVSVKFKVPSTCVMGTPTLIADDDAIDWPSLAAAHRAAIEAPLPDVTPAANNTAATVNTSSPGGPPQLASNEAAADAEQRGDEEATTATEEEETKMTVDPWSVTGKVDYDKLVKEFGSQRIDDNLLERLRKLTKHKKLHRFLRRGVFFSHRDLDKLCACVEQNKPFYLYTGRGPSSAAMHLGHLVPFVMTQWLQEAFGVPLVVQMTDDEKFLWKGEYDETKGDFNVDYYRTLTRENAKDVIACGFQKSKTFIFSDCDYMGHMYPVVLRIWKAITYNTARAAFGFKGDSNVGQSAFPAIQAAPSFANTFPIPLKNVMMTSSQQPTKEGDDDNGNETRTRTNATVSMANCLIPCAIDQDPYFRVTRDIAKKFAPASHALGGKPALVHSTFFPPLQGATGKMSASDPNSAIFLTDSPDDIARKIKTHAFSGGRETAKEQKLRGADLSVDVAFKWLTFFLEDDDELAKIEREYGSGQGEYWNTNAVKNKLIDVLQTLVSEHQAKRAAISDAELDEWFAIRPLDPPDCLLSASSSSSV